MMNFDVHNGEKGDALRKNLLVRYFAKPASHSSKKTELYGGSGISGAGIHSTLSGGTGVGVCVGQSSSLTTHGPGGRLLSRGEMCLPEVQVYLDREGISDLVAELVMKSSLLPNVFMEAVQLGIALLEGGNPVIQRSLYTKLQSAETSAIFFKVFHDKVRESQAEIKSTMSVNTIEMASAGNNKLKDHSHEMKDHFPYDMKMKHQRMMSTRASNGNVTVGERMDPYSDSWNSSRLDDSTTTTTTLSSVNLTLENLVRQQQQPKSLTTATDSDMESKLSAKVLVMLPVFRFLQLLCENHNRDLQNFLRAQSNKKSYNLVSDDTHVPRLHLRIDDGRTGSARPLH
ncbi:inositol 1,4,5-trisphosphate receptor-like isoform X1 [Daphnia pulex]|uniref:inositol 1,4,5-trisphosphate receptor-like isoform X1 n=1 Tax=Daphnia pulex TaxID=6669 RepID=UPI001EE10A6E|nr:inositol 1,4,5-trisphosphate receptor-like isoform X1 [Daphnia pulex]